jgi:soluble lytic murein transglycosylase-like protein
MRSPITELKLRMLARLVLCLLLAALFAWPLAGLAQAPQRVIIPPAAAKHEAALRREAQRIWGLGAPTATFAAQVHQESRWREDARSPVGALGIAQFMPTTARWMGDIDPSLAERAPLNPTWALRALVSYDLWLHQRIRHATDACERMAYTLSAYNGGLGWVYKRQGLARAQGHDPAVCLGSTCDINPGIAPANQRENEHYPRVILSGERAYWRWGARSCPSREV